MLCTNIRYFKLDCPELHSCAASRRAPFKPRMPSAPRQARTLLWARISTDLGARLTPALSHPSCKHGKTITKTWLFSAKKAARHARVRIEPGPFTLFSVKEKYLMLHYKHTKPVHLLLSPLRLRE